MKKQEFATLACTLVVLGIIFGGADRLLGYSFIGAGVLLSVISVFKTRRKEEVSPMEAK